MGPQQATFSLSLGLASFKALIEESEIKKFPDNDLLRHLRLVTQDAEKCASVAQQLLNGKRQTRSGPGLRAGLCGGGLGPLLLSCVCHPGIWEWGMPVFSLGFLGLCLCRYRSGGGKSPNQLTVSELRQFVTQLYALPCVLSQTPLLKVAVEAPGRVLGRPAFCKSVGLT